MTLEELKNEKQKLEEQISEQLNDFRKKYNVIINEINMSSTTSRTTTGLVKSEIYIDIEIKL